MAQPGRGRTHLRAGDDVVVPQPAPGDLGRVVLVQHRVEDGGKKASYKIVTGLGPEVGEGAHTPPFSIYSAPGGLPQDPGHAA